MNRTAITIIVPVYHKSEFLKECLTSLREQDFSLPYQVVMIDCSAEESCRNLAKSFERMDNRFFYYRWDVNQGPGYSRNLGIFHSAGEYISFVDGDDVVKDNYLSELYEKAKKTNADVVTCGYYLFDGKKRFPGYSRVRKTTDGKTVLKRIYKSPRGKFRTFCWGRLYKKSLLLENRIFFPSDLIQYEDWLFVNAVLIHAKKVVFVKKMLYGYRQRYDSIMSDYHDRFAFHKIAIERSISYITSKDDAFAKKLFTHLSLLVRMQLYYDLKGMKHKEKKEKIQEVEKLFYKR